MDHTSINELIDRLESSDPAAAPEAADELAAMLARLLDPEVAD